MNPYPITSKRHPLRSLELAGSLARAMGAVCVLIGSLSTFMLFPVGGPRDAVFAFGFFLAVVAPVLIVPGVLYLCFAGPMLRRKKWALVTVLVFASAHTALNLLVLILSLFGGLDAACFVVFEVFFLLLSSMLIVHCSASFPALRPPGATMNTGGRGFEPIVASPPPRPPAAFPLPPRSLKAARGPEAGDVDDSPS